jgi:acetyl-CoA acetyltransferase
MESRNVVLVDGARTGFARGARGSLVATRLDEAAAKVIRALLDKHPRVKDSMIEDIGLGNVAGRGEFTGLEPIARIIGLAIGHPGATGARLVTTVAKELRRSNTKYGLATQCIGAGMGISTIVENLDV